MVDTALSPYQDSMCDVDGCEKPWAVITGPPRPGRALCRDHAPSVDLDEMYQHLQYS